MSVGKSKPEDDRLKDQMIARMRHRHDILPDQKDNVINYEDGDVIVLGSKQVQEKINSASQSKMFIKSVEVLQTVVRCVHPMQRQLGNFFWIHFHAPIDEENPEMEINYDYK